MERDDDERNAMVVGGQCALLDSLQLGYGFACFWAENRGPSPQALESLRQRAEQGDGRAQASLGMAHLLGQGAAQGDDLEAFRWFRKAVDQGDALGKSGLAAMYERSRAVPQDDLSWDAPPELKFKTGDKVELGITWTTMYIGYGTNFVTRSKTECYYRYKTAGKQKQLERKP